VPEWKLLAVASIPQIRNENRAQVPPFLGSNSLPFLGSFSLRGSFVNQICTFNKITSRCFSLRASCTCQVSLYLWFLIWGNWSPFIEVWPQACKEFVYVWLYYCLLIAGLPTRSPWLPALIQVAMTSLVCYYHVAVWMLFQLQDLRRVIARMLAVDTGSHTVPDYEIISRLEKLILAMQANSSAPGGMMMMPALDDIVGGLSDEFRSGYCSAGRLLADTLHSRSPAKPTPSRPRPGPRKLDSKVY